MFSLFKRKLKHEHNLRRLFGQEYKYAVYGCDDCGKCFLLDFTGMNDDTHNMPDWQIRYPKESNNEAITYTHCSR